MDVLNMWEAIPLVLDLKLMCVSGFKDLSGETVADYDEIVRRVRELRRGELDMTLARLMNQEKVPLSWVSLKGTTIPPFVTGMKALLAENEKMLSSATSLADLKGTDVFYVRTMDGAQPEELGNVFEGNEKLIFVEPQDYSGTTRLIGTFSGCPTLVAFSSNGSLRNLEVAEKVFSECWNLRQVNLLKDDLKNATWTYRLFYDCNSLKSISINQLGENLSMEEMFFHCDTLESVNLSVPLTGEVFMRSAFYACPKLTSISTNFFSHADSISATDAFGYTSLPAFEFPMLSLTRANGTFWGADKLRRVRVKSLNIPANRLNTFGGTFRKCSSLEIIQIRDACSIETGNSLFYKCERLSWIEGLDFSHLCLLVSDLNEERFGSVVSNIFFGCTSLANCELGGTLYKSGVDLRPCAKLSARSLYTWVAALYDWEGNPEGKTTDDTDHTLYLTDAQQTTLMDYAGDDGESGEEAYLTALDRGWAISA